MLIFIVTDRNDQIVGAFSTIEAAARAVREHPGSELQHLHAEVATLMDQAVLSQLTVDQNSAASLCSLCTSTW